MKEALTKKLIQQLSQSIADLDTYIATSQEEALQAPGAMQSQHDTTKKEAGYRVNGLLQRKAFLLQAIQAITEFIPYISNSYTQIKLGSYVITQDNQNNRKNYFLLPAGEGEILEKEDASHHIYILSPHSPLFPLLENKKKDETYIFRDKQFTIIDIQ